MIKLWNAINGWKTVAAAIYWPVMEQIVPIWFPNGGPPLMHKILVTLGIILTMLGVGHKFYKQVIQPKNDPEGIAGDSK
jgi:hypothetical protein